MRFLRRAIFGFVFLALAACSGGGGGGGGQGGNGAAAGSLKTTLDRASLSFEVYQGQTAEPQQVLVNAEGDYSGALYMSATLEGTGINSNIPVSISGKQGSLLISPDVTLAPGRYNGRILASLCSDAQCANRIGGTPLPIAYTVTVLDPVKVSKERVILAAKENTWTTSEFIKVTPAEGQTDFVVTPQVSWLGVSSYNTEGFEILARAQPAGRHIGTLEVRSGTSTKLVTVDFASTSAPGNPNGLYATPDTLTFNLMPEMQSSQNVTVTYPGATHATVTEGSPWLTVTGTSPYSVNVSTSGLTHGTYTGVVHIEPVSATNAVALVNVVLHVGPTLTATTVGEVTVDSSTLPAAFIRSSTIGLLGETGGTWSATTNTPWLQLNRVTGPIGTALDFTLSSADVDELGNFTTHVGTIHVTSSVAGVREIDIPVVVRKNIARVTGLGPQIQISGRPLKTIVRGQGFTAAGAARLQIAGAPITNATLVDDTTLIAETPSLSAGSYVVDVRNELGFSTLSRTLRVINPVEPAYAVVPNSGAVRSLFYDPLRTSVYAIRSLYNGDGAEQLRRFRLNGGTWQDDLIDVPNLINAGLTNDAAYLVFTHRTGQLSHMNAATLEPLSPMDAPEAIRPLRYIFGAQGPVPVTNDGRVWFASEREGLDNNWLTYYDPVQYTTTFRHQPDRAGTSYVRTPRLAVSRNGQKMVVDGNASQSTTPVLLLSASTSEFTPTSLTGNCFGVLNDDGRRVACGTKIYNGNMQLLATLQLNATDLGDGWTLANPRSETSTNPVFLSPDGNRAYAYAINSHDFSYLPTGGPGGGTPPVPTHPPRVYVFDISSDTPTTNIVSSTYIAFDTLVFPGCREWETTLCNAEAVGTIAPDGRTLYLAGDQNLIVLPIPAAHR